MHVTTIGHFVDNILSYVKYAIDGEVIEIVTRDGKELQLKLKDKEEE